MPGACRLRAEASNSRCSTVMLMGRFDKIFRARRRPFPLWKGVALAVGLVFLPGPAAGQLPPDESWRTLETSHFRVTYPEGLEELARRAGERAERAWGLLEQRFVEAPSGTVDLVLTDHADISNGYSNVFPSNRIVIFAPPPVDDYSLSLMDEWMELVVTHELVHIFHFDLDRGLTRAFRSVFGRLPVSWPSFPGSATPGWTVEGIATYYESALTRGGRIRGSFHDMILRTAVLEGAFESLNQVSGDSPVWPGGQRYYVYGSLFLHHLLETHGEEAMGRFVEAVAGQWVPFRLDAAAQEAFGESFSQAWDRWRQELEARYGALEEELAARGPLTVPETLTGEGHYALHPAPSPTGDDLAFARFDGRSDIQIRLLSIQAPESRKLARTNSLSALAWAPGGRVLFSQLEYNDPYRIWDDLYLADREGKVTRLTEGKRLDHPHVAPDGEVAVAVQDQGGTNRLVLVTLDTGEVRPLTSFRSSIHWAYPRWSPDGRWIAVSRWQTGAYYDIVLLDPDGQVVREITRDRAVDLWPVWSPDGRWLIWSSDRSGIPNLYAVEVGPASGQGGPLRQVTNLLGGAAYPAVDPRGRWLYFSGYHHDGWHIERIPLDPEAWFTPHPPDPDFSGTPETERFSREAEGPGEPYDPLATLRPTYWIPAYRSEDDAGSRQVLNPAYGLSTSGRDLVGRHRYDLLGLFSRGAATFNGGASYAYAGFGNPVMSVWFSQNHDAEGALQAPDGGQERLFVVERERSIGLGGTFTRRRSRNAVSLGLSGSHIWEHRSLLDENLKESEDFRLIRPDSRFAQARMALSIGTARRFPFSVSPEDGLNLFLQVRGRRHLALADSLQGLEGEDRSYHDVMGQLSLYKSLPLPGFGRHVLAFRGSGGVAGGPGADPFHYEVGGAAGGGGPISRVRLGQALFFPVRGFGTARRWGRYAWSASAEYRFPIWLINGGPGLLPLHLDWLSGSVFLDSGNAWGPELGWEGWENPRRDALISAGAELTLRVMPFWYGNLEVRTGAALPLAGGDGPQFYIRLGPAF